MADAVKAKVVGYLTKSGFTFAKTESGAVFPYKGEQIQIVCQSSSVCVYVLMSDKIGQSQRKAVSASMAKVNMTLAYGNWEMDLRDGEVRYKSSICFTGLPGFFAMLHAALDLGVDTYKKTKDRAVPGASPSPSTSSSPSPSGSDGSTLGELERFLQILKNIGGDTSAQRAGDEKADVKDEFPLLAAVRAGDLAKTRELIRAGNNVNQQNSEGITGLVAAATRGFTEIAELLLQAGANINHENKNKDTPLSLAVWKNHSATALLFLKKGASIHHVDKFGDTPLHDAVKNNMKEVVKALKAAGSDAHKANQKGETPIALALQAGLMDLVALLLA